MPIHVNLTSPKGQFYAEPKATPDENAFQINNTSDKYYNSPYYLLHKSQVQAVPPARNGVPPYLKLEDFIPKTITDAINHAGTITFHAVGDTGAAKVNARTRDQKHQRKSGESVLCPKRKFRPHRNLYGEGVCRQQLRQRRFTD